MGVTRLLSKRSPGRHAARSRQLVPPQRIQVDPSVRSSSWIQASGPSMGTEEKGHRHQSTPRSETIRFYISRRPFQPYPIERHGQMSHGSCTGQRSTVANGRCDNCVPTRASYGTAHLQTASRSSYPFRGSSLALCQGHQRWQSFVHGVH